MESRGVFVKLNATPPTFKFPEFSQVADGADGAGDVYEKPRPHDPYIDNGIPVPYFGLRPPVKDNIVRCHNDVEDGDYLQAARNELKNESPREVTEEMRSASENSPFHQIIPTGQHRGHACWWCCHIFPGTAVGLPVRCNGVPPRETLTTYGYFCSYPCALAWAKDKRSFHKHIPLLHYTHKRLFDSFHLESAPPREMLSLFGGSMSIETFRASAAAGKRFQVIETPSLVPLRMYVEDLAQAAHESTSIVQTLRKRAK